MKKNIYFLPLCLMILFHCATLHSQTVHFKEEFDMPGEQIQAIDHTATNDGGTMIVTFSSSLNATKSFTFIKTTATGTLQWTKRLVGPSIAMYDNVVQAADSGYFLCYVDYAAASPSYGILKLNSAGNVDFTNQLSVAAPYFIVGAPEVLAKNDGGFYVISDVVDTVAYTYMWHVFEISAAGNLVWSHAYNINPTKCYHQGMDTCLNGDLILTGYQSDPATNNYFAVLSRISASGSPIWTKHYATPNRNIPPVSVVRMSSDYFYVLATSYNPVQATTESVLMKTDGQGNNLWSFIFSSPVSSVEPYQLIAAENNSTVITGTMNGGAMMIKADSTGLITCARGFRNDIFISMDTLPNGTYVFVGQNYSSALPVLMTTGPCGSTCEDTLLTVMKTPLPIILSSDSSDISMPMTLTPISLTPAFATVHTIEICNTVGMEETENLPEIRVYPVPATGVVRIESSEVIAKTELLDVHGRVVRSVSVHATSHQIDLSDLAAGVYYLRVSSDSETTTRKIIVQH